MRRGGSAGWTNGTAHGSAGGRTTASMTPHGSGAPAPASPSCLFQAGNVTRTDRQFQESEPPPPTGSIGLRGSRNISVSQAMNECRRGTHVLRARARTCRSAPDADVPPLPAVGACRGGRRRRNAAQLRATPRLAGRHSHATGDDGQPQLPGTRRSHGRGDPARGRGRRGNATQRPGRHPWAVALPVPVRCMPLPRRRWRGPIGRGFPWSIHGGGSARPAPFERVWIDRPIGGWDIRDSRIDLQLWMSRARTCSMPGVPLLFNEHSGIM